MNALKYERGITVLGFLVYALLIIFTSVIAIRLVPVYLDDYAVSDAIKSLATTPGINQFSQVKLKDAFERKLQTNFVSSMPKDALKAVKKDDRYFLTIDYEQRIHLIANIDAVVMFNHEVPVATS